MNISRSRSNDRQAPPAASSKVDPGYGEMIGAAPAEVLVFLPWTDDWWLSRTYSCAHNIETQPAATVAAVVSLSRLPDVRLCLR